jgi:hypothetical protein
MADQGEPSEILPLEDSPLSKAKSSRRAKKGRTVRRLILAVALVALFFGIVRPAFFIVDAWGHGPYTRRYNRECYRLAEEAQLVGRPEADIIAILGPPTKFWDYEGDGGTMRTYEYFPTPPFPRGIFQVQCSSGIVTRLEELVDD